MKQITLNLGIGFNRAGLPLRRVQSRLRGITTKAVELFGGATLLDSIGSWRNGKGKLVSEQGKTLIVFAAGKGVSQKAVQLAQFAKQELEQESVLLSIQPVDSKFI